MNAVDFSTYYVKSLDQGTLDVLAQNARLAMLGFDTSPESGTVLSALLGAGLSWHAYRFLYWAQDVSQVQDCIDAIHQYSPTVAQLPAYLWLDCEENPGGAPAPANPTDYLHRVMDYVESRDITPSSLVKPGIYTRQSYWNTYLSGYTEPAQRGWALWTAEPGRGSTPDTALLYGGWQRSQVLAVQTRESVQLGSIEVDLDVLRDGPAPSVDVRGLLTQAQGLIAQALQGI